MSVAAQLILNGILTASFYALIASGLSFIYSTSKIFHLAHGVVIVFSGYVFWWLTKELHIPIILSVLLSIFFSGVLGVAMNEFVYESLRERGTKGLGYIIATLSLLILGTACILLLFGASPRSFQFETRVFEFAHVRVTEFQLGILAATAVLLTALYGVQKYTKFGKAMRATSDNEVVAEILGINTKNIRRLAFFFSALLAAPAGILLGLEFNLDPNMGILLAVLGYSAMVIGGIGSFAGPLSGALILGVSEQLAVWYGGAGWKHAIAFFLLFVFLLFRPNGIFGGKQIFK